MAENESFAALMQRLRSGDESAAVCVFDAFAGRLIALARHRLDARLQQKLDPDDVVQSAFKSFFVRYGRGAYQLDDWGSLWSLLARITLRKCGHRIERYYAARRDVRREINAGAAVDPTAAVWEPLAREPTPSEAAMLVETVEALMRELNDRDRQILMLSLQGAACAEVSTEVGCTERTVFRVLKFLKERLEQMRAAAAGP